MTWRWKGRIPAVFLLACTVAAVAGSLSPVSWHLEFVRAHQGAMFPLFAGAILGVAVAMPLAYHLLLRRGLWRYEPLLVAGVCVGVFLREPVALAVCVFVATIAFAVGRSAVRRLEIDLPPLQEMVVCTGAGLAGLSWIFFFLGIAGGYRPWVFLTLLGGCGLLLWRDVRELWRTLVRLHQRWGESEELRHPLAALLVAMLAALAVCGTLVSVAPSITFDPLKFHLPLAAHYSEHGGLDLMNIEVYTYYPQGLEVLMTAGHALAGQIAAQTIPVIFFLLLLAALVAVLRECGVNLLGALAGVTFAAAIPYVHWTGVNPKNDLMIAFYQLAALLVFLRWRSDRRFRWILVGVFFLAASACVKLPALFGIVGLLPLYIYAWATSSDKARNLAVATMVFVVFGTVWQVRTWANTGNPVYPHGASVPVTIRALDSDPGQPEPSKFEVLLLWPWKALFEGQGFESVTPNPLGIALLFLAPLGFLIRGTRLTRACWIFVAVTLGYWCLFFPILRYVIAPVSLMLALLGARIPVLCRSRHRGYQLWGYSVSAATLAFSLGVVIILEINAPQISLVSGRITKREFLRQALLTYPPLEFLNDRAQPGEAIFGVNNCSRAYAPDPELFGCEYVDPDPEGAALAQELISRRDYRYVILPSDPGYNPLIQILSSDRRLEQIYDDAHFRVYGRSAVPIR